MIDLLNILLLAVVQGLTEFLPISSSGHLVLLQRALGAHEGDIFFAVVLHVGTLGSVLVVYRAEVRRLLRLDAAARRYVLALAVGTVPAVVVVLLAEDAVDAVFGQPVFAAGGLLLTAVVLFSTRAAYRPAGAPDGPWEPRAPRAWRALVVGSAQALAILPGVSRSGSTIAACLWLGVERTEAARFSFLLAVPAIGGALVHQLAKGALDGGLAVGHAGALVLAAATAFAVGLLAIRWTALAVVRSHFWKFGFYCLGLGTIALFVLL